MRTVKRSLVREVRAWGVALVVVLAYLTGSWGAECWPGVRDWFNSHYGAPR